MKILVCGGRNYSDSEKLDSVLDELHSSRCVTFLVHGSATGADTLAWDWAEKRNIEWLAYKADWMKHGRSAGPKRNQLMLDHNPDIKMVVAFPGGKGTEDMIRRAEAKGIEVLRVK